jgi:hypothetical protein
MKSFTFIVFLLAVPVCPSFAQSFDLGSWNIINVKYKHSDQLSFFGEAQLRSLKFYNHFHYYEYKAGLNVKVHKQVKLTLGAGSYQTYKEGGDFVLPKNNDEFRVWPQLILFQDLYKFKIEQRYRAEMRWTSNGYRNRFRYRIGISYPFGKDSKGYKPFQVSFSNELFFTDHEPYFERNRMQFTFQYKASKHAALQIGYLHQFDYRINDETGRDFLVLGIYCDLFRKTSAKTDEDIKDN